MADTTGFAAAGEAALASFSGGVRAIRQRTDAARAALADLAAGASSADGAVALAVDANGVLTSLRFGPDAFALGPDGLSTTVLMTACQARINGLRLARDKIADITGADSPAIAVLDRQRVELDDRFPSAAVDVPVVPVGDPEEPAVPRSAPAAAAEPVPAKVEDDDLGFTGRG